MSPEMANQFAILRKRLDNIEKLISPDRPTLDKQTVLRLLKIRPKQLGELEVAGILMSHIEGNKTIYYEDDVMRCYAKQSPWKNALEEASRPANGESIEPAGPVESKETAKSEVEPTEPDAPEMSLSVMEATGRIDINVACEIVGRNPGAIYQLIKTNVIPSYKDGRKVYFNAEELKEWVKTHPPRKYTKRNETEIPE
jgi:excisionase family DNA binding protein